jgi:hypothetical protein
MDKYYLTLDKSISQTISQPISQPISQTIIQTIKNSPKIKKDVKIIPSPKTLRKNISNENFIKFQWPWLL